MDSAPVPRFEATTFPPTRTTWEGSGWFTPILIAESLTLDASTLHTRFLYNAISRTSPMYSTKFYLSGIAARQQEHSMKLNDLQK